MTRLTLDLESGMPVEGRVLPEGGAERRFTGYAGLIAALEAIREGDDRGAPQGVLGKHGEGRWPTTSDGT